MVVYDYMVLNCNAFLSIENHDNVVIIETYRSGG